MSKTTTSQPEPDAGREVQPVAALTGPAAAVFTELHSLDNSATVAALALAAGISRSTASKALVTLESTGLAARTPGGNDQARRLPDLWRLTSPSTAQAPEHLAEADTGETPSDPAPADAAPAPAIDAAPLRDGNGGPPQRAGAEPDADGSDAVGTDQPDGESAPTVAVDPAESGTGPDGGGGPEATDAGAATHTPEPAADVPMVPPGHVCPTCGHRRRAAAPKTTTSSASRLAQGQLHQMALDHLRAHPDEDWTATGIANVIGRSSGAIANALVTMVSRGEAAQTCDKPRRYRATGATAGG